MSASSFSLRLQQRLFTKRRLLAFGWERSCYTSTYLADTIAGTEFRTNDPFRFQQAIKRNYSISMTLRSPEAATTVKPKAAPFLYPKAEELFHRIVQRCETKDDARALQRTVYELLGKPLRDFEFLIDGFGGKKSKGGGGGSSAEVSEPVKEEKKIFDVKLVGYDSSIKLKIIKEIRSILPGLGLKEAKELVESAPCTLQKGLQPEQAEAIKQKLVELGAQIELV